MKISEVYPAKYLKPSDLGEEGVRTLSIDGVEIEYIEGDDVPMLYFRGERKPMRLNKTNGMVLAQLYGDETEDWAGQRIELYSVPVQNPRGEMVDGIRLRAPKPARAARPVAVVEDDGEPARPRRTRRAPPAEHDGEPEPW